MRRFVTAFVKAAVLSGRLPAPVINVTLAAARSFADALGRIANRTELLELGNSLEAIRCFATFRFDAASLPARDQRLAALGRPAGSARTLSFNEPTFEALWALEGLGYRYARPVRKVEPNRPVDLGVVARLPVRQQGIFHVGVTMVLAEDYLARAAASSSGPQGAVGAYLRICAERAPGTLRGVEAESLGFVTVTLFPQILPQVADVVSGDDQPLSAFFWHGVGRGLYLNNPPALGASGRSWPALRATLHISWDAQNEANALQGYGWALGLVNLRQPTVIRARLNTFSPSGRDIEHLARGLREAFLCWLRWNGWDGQPASINALTPTDGQQADTWRELVSTVLGQHSDPDAPRQPSDPTYGNLLA